MKKLKLKDFFLEKYQKVHELEMDGITVRVWKPRTMGKLPAYCMKTVIKEYNREARHWCAFEKKALFTYGNPDYGMWDARVVRYTDPRHKTLDIYFCALLIRPFSREAFEYYKELITFRQPEILGLCWDSRQFDSQHGYDTSYGRLSNMDEWEVPLYHVNKDGERDIEDKTCERDDGPIVFDFGDSQPGLSFRFRVKDGYLQNNSSWSKDIGLVPEHFEENLKDTLNNFMDFHKAHPEFVEMHFYTEPTFWGEDEEEPAADEE